MKSVLLIGLGRFGTYMARKLTELGNEVLAVDSNETLVNDTLGFVTSAQIGDATNERFIESLGVSNFDLCVVAIGSNFQSSLEATALLKDHGAPFVLARAIDDSHAKFLLRNGADDVVYPEKQTATWSAVSYSDDNIFQYMELTPEYSVYETATPRRWVGKTVQELDVRKNYRVNILGTKCDDVMTLLEPSHPFSGQETLFVLGADADMRKFMKLM